MGMVWRNSLLLTNYILAWLASGVYIYKLSAGRHAETKKLVIVR